jgi:DNA-binding beta-propeller fold protein YncE
MKHAIVALLLSLALPGPSLAQDGPYRFVKEIAIGGDGGWDYLSVDPAAHRLFVSHGTKIVVVDTEHDRIEGEITGVTGVHGLTIAPDLARGFSANGGEDTVGIVDLRTLKILQKVRTGKDPDTIAYDPLHSTVYAFGKGDGSATAFDAKTGAIVATFPLGGTPQATVVDAKRGRIYVNLEDRSAVAVIDTTSRKVTTVWSIAPGENQSGLAIDLERQRLFVGCRNKLMVMLDATTGEGTVTIAREDSPATLTTIQTLTTRPFARTMTVDPSTHRIYLAVSDFQPRAPGEPGRPAAIPGTFRVLVYDVRAGQ